MELRSMSIAGTNISIKKIPKCLRFSFYFMSIKIFYRHYVPGMKNKHVMDFFLFKTKIAHSMISLIWEI